MMMSGMVSLQVDPKGRLRIPSKYRSALGDENSVIFAMINSNGCLNIISKEKAEEIITKLSKVVSIAVTERSRAARLILSSVSELKEDGQDRFTLPPMLKKFAGINKNVVFAGMGNSLELWDADRWDEMHSIVNDPEEFRAAVASLEDILTI